MEQNALDPLDASVNEPLVVEPLFSTAQPESAPTAEPENPSPRKTKRKVLPIFLGIVAGLLAVSLVIGLCTNWFGFYGPATKLVLAGKKTLDAKSMTIDTVLTVGKHSREYTLTLYFDPNERTLTALAVDDDGDGIFAICQGYFIKGRKATDISTSLDAVYDLLDSKPDKEKDWEQRIQAISQELYDAMDGVVNFDRLNQCLLRLFRSLNSNKWLEENMGYSTFKNDGTTTYRFQPDTYQLASAVLECFEDAFCDTDGYQNVQDMLKEKKSTLDALDYKVRFGINRKYLSKLSLDFDTGSTLIGLDLQFHSFGSTDIDTEKLEKMIKRVR